MNESKAIQVHEDDGLNKIISCQKDAGKNFDDLTSKEKKNHHFLELFPAYTAEEIAQREQMAGAIADAVSAATSAQAVKGATPASVRAATMAALGVSPQVNDPGQLELGDAEVNTI